ncbi:hypothetical protein IIA79_01760 [bacterium]|nr:hypothetical protein [bacterium]
MRDADSLETAVFIGSGPDQSEHQRLPEHGWLRCGLRELSILAQSLSLPPAVIKKATDQLIEGVREAAGILDDIGKTHPGATAKIAVELKQEDGEQTRKMAATILTNAFVFHGTLSGGPGELAAVRSIEELRSESSILNKSTILGEWRRILAINYWPIFDIARRILEVIPADSSAPLLEKLQKVASQLLARRLMRSHDLTGAVFQRMIADRKFLAAFYTRPASAALLVNLVLTPEQPLAAEDWTDAAKVKALRIADFACGTGTLLSTAYQRVGQLHEIAGGNAELLHPDMMASSLIGCDVLPAAAHLTASMLAGVHPTVQYSNSAIYTVAYGKLSNDAIALGSLNLLPREGRLEYYEITAMAAEATGEREQPSLRVLDSSLDIVLMNPPFTRQTGHHEINSAAVPNPMFAAFSSSEEEQRLMAAATKLLIKDTQATSAHGNAGEASIFLALADRKLKKDGVLGLVMPLSLMSGDAWERSRALLRKKYSDLILVSISGAAGKQLSFSADTGMGECLIIGRKDKQDSKRAVFVVLKERPTTTLQGMVCAGELRQLIKAGELKRLEDGPIGGTPLHFGNDEIGWVLDSPLPSSGGWNVGRIADLSLAQTAYQLADMSRIWLPGMTESESIIVPITLVAKIGKIGPLDRDINGKGSDGSFRGPFDIAPVAPESPCTYPVLWSHDAKRERTMLFPHDSEGRQRAGSSAQIKEEISAKVSAVQNTASHCHFNRDFRFNSQSTSMQFTPRLAIGGRAWPSIKLDTKDQEKALVLWSNTSFGLLLYWWLANKQQMGRGVMVRSVLKHLPVLDVTALNGDQLAKAVRVFDETCMLELLPAH